MGEIMAGLIPIRRTVEELDRANAKLLREHQEYLASWIEQRKHQSSEDFGREANKSTESPAAKFS